ncbi:unnamed protein product [Cyclocybe aegerita]|uniref:BAR-domain-containing protein n=1 Tax=Cyclocybe aegerita TaxID=1973307 RepID=A0A8S0WZF4_CYCAE|nr:unnamed protein product [Cyclocybe aegerita]
MTSIQASIAAIASREGVRIVLPRAYLLYKFGILFYNYSNSTLAVMRGLPIPGLVYGNMKQIMETANSDREVARRPRQPFHIVPCSLLVAKLLHHNDHRMASKQLGRLRQWAGEVISSREKTTVNEEFQDLEKDIELRKSGIQKLLIVSEGYQHALSKKKANEALKEGEKFLPIDTLGIAMISHGEEFGEDSAFGDSLVKVGRAHCKIATLQEAYALTFKDTFIASLGRFRDEIKEYEALKKKLDARRAACDTAVTKFEKLQNSKKEKDKREAEDEMEKSKQRYEETEEDMRAHMHAIQENEHLQMHELRSFIDLEANFIQSYLDILKDIKSDWEERPNHQPKAKTFQTPTKSKAARQKRTDSSPSPDSSDEGAGNSHSFPRKHSRTGSTSSRPPSRPSSRLSRKRANSTAASTVNDDDKEKEEKKEGDKSRRLSVAGWASSAVESVTGSKGKKNKDTDSFATLDDDDKPSTDGHVSGDGSLRKSSSLRALARRTSSRKKSKENLPASANNSPVPTGKILKPPSMQDRKLVRALYDFSGSSDELSFKAGSEIVVVQEVLDDWWMGEVNGQRGIFPASYTEVVGTRLAGPQWPYKGDQSNVQHNKNGSAEDKDNDTYLMSDADDNDLTVAPMAINRSPVFYGAFNDAASFTDSMAEADSDADLPPKRHQWKAFSDDDWFNDGRTTQTASAPGLTIIPPRPSNRAILDSLDSAQQPLISRSQSDNPTSSSTNSGSIPSKKMPPPPPPRRAMSHNPTMTPPAIPAKRLPGQVATALIAAQSTTTSLSTMSGFFSSRDTPSAGSLSAASSISSHGHNGPSQGGGYSGYDRSPFESAVELELEAGEGERMGSGRCTQFRQNPFKPKGMCSNCLEFHT